MGRWGSCDFRQLENLHKRLAKLQKQDFDAFCKAMAKDLAARLLAKVIKRTPVGKTASHAEDVVDDKGNAVTYKKGKNKGKAKQRKVVDHMGGTLRRSWSAGEITKHGGMYQIEIINPQLYASYVEYGHRQQAGRYVPALGKKLKAGWVKGRFMLTISEQELQAQAPALVEMKLAKLLGECLNGE